MTATVKNTDKERRIVQESTKTKRAREKLLKQLESERKQFTPRALKETIEKIHKWIADNSKYRVRIEKKTSIKLFNQNIDFASISKKVESFAKSLKTELDYLNKEISKKIN